MVWLFLLFVGASLSAAALALLASLFRFVLVELEGIVAILKRRV